MRNPGGYAVLTDGEGVIEFDTLSCAHCQRIAHLKAKQRPEDVGGLCYGCMKPICPKCVDTGVCDPIEEKLKREEASYHARRSYGL